MLKNWFLRHLVSNRRIEYWFLPLLIMSRFYFEIHLLRTYSHLEVIKITINLDVSYVSYKCIIRTYNICVTIFIDFCDSMLLRNNHVISIVLLVFSLNRAKSKHCKEFSVFAYKRFIHETISLTLWTLQDETICLHNATIDLSILGHCPYTNYLSFVYYRFYFLFSFLPTVHDSLLVLCLVYLQKKHLSPFHWHERFRIPTKHGFLFWL